MQIRKAVRWYRYQLYAKQQRVRYILQRAFRMRVVLRKSYVRVFRFISRVLYVARKWKQMRKKKRSKFRRSKIEEPNTHTSMRWMISNRLYELCVITSHMIITHNSDYGWQGDVDFNKSPVHRARHSYCVFVMCVWSTSTSTVAKASQQHRIVYDAIHLLHTQNDNTVQWLSVFVCVCVCFVLPFGHFGRLLLCRD